MNPGGVTSDKEAFELIRVHLENDVGTILTLIEEHNAKHSKTNGTPYWALVRMMFPNAEALGDLIHQNKSTSQNLTSVLEAEFEEVRPGYKGKAATLALIYRHSLTHTDELRTLVVDKRAKVKWRLSCFEKDTHLRVESEGPDTLRLSFDTTAFYDNLVEVCDNAIGKQWGGRVKATYDKWLVLNLDPKKKDNTQVEKAAINEIINRLQ